MIKIGIKDFITNNFTNRIFPGNRSDSQNTLYDYFIDQYQWVNHRDTNKQLGDYQIFYMAKKNVYVNAALNAYYHQLLANGFTIKNPYLEYIDKERVNYLTGLFNAPEGLRSNIRYAQFLRLISNSYLLTGDAFIAISYDKILDKDIINGFKYIPPELIRYYEDTSQYGFLNYENLRFESDELIHIYDVPVDANNKFGESRIETIGLALSLFFESLKYNKDFFKNKGLDPNAILSFDKDMGDTAFMDEIRRLSVAAKEKSGRGMLAVKGGSISSINRNVKDGDFEKLLITARNIILNGFNCPPSLAGIVESANLSANTIDSEMRVFKPFVNSVAQTIEGGFNQALGRNGFSEVFEFNPIDLTDQMQEMQVRKMELETGLKSINEIRKDMGLESVPWGNTPYSSFNSPLTASYTPDKLESAVNLVQQAKTDLWRTYEY